MSMVIVVIKQPQWTVCDVQKLSWLWSDLCEMGSASMLLLESKADLKNIRAVIIRRCNSCPQRFLFVGNL